MGKWEVGKRAQRCGIREPAATVRQPAGAVTESFSAELLELSESAARRRLGAQHGVGARPESVRPPRRRPPATRRQRQLTADADAVGHATERTFQEALENVSVAYFPMLFFGRSAASPYSLAETASRPRPPSAVRPPPGPSGAALPRLFQTANRRRSAAVCMGLAKVTTCRRRRRGGAGVSLLRGAENAPPPPCARQTAPAPAPARSARLAESWVYLT